MIAFPLFFRRAVIMAFPLLCLASTNPPPSTLAGTWDIPDHPLHDGGTYHMYLELNPTPTGLSGHISYPWGYLPVASVQDHANHFQLFGDHNDLLAEGDHTPDALHIVLKVGRQAGPTRTATKIPSEPLPEKLPTPSLTPIASIGDAPTPPMGWNSWNNFKEAIDDRTVRSVADAMVASGMRDAGYTYLNIDDAWQGPRDARGNITTNLKFPDMKSLADYVHARGLKLGLYSSPGPLTCAGYAGSLGHEEQDANTFASWGIDYLKYDWCSAAKIYQPNEMRAVYQKMGDALKRTHRSILFSLCQYGEADVWTWAPAVGANLWRTTPDIADTWSSMSHIGFSQDKLAAFASPGHWNDPDMLEVGNGNMTTEEYRTHFSLWSLLAAPLLAGNDIVHMNAPTRAILLNREVIALDQDPAGKQATRLQLSGEQEIWSKPLADGSVALGLFNRSNAEASIQLPASLFHTETLHTRDLWQHTDILLHRSSPNLRVPSHGVLLLRLAQH